MDFHRAYGLLFASDFPLRGLGRAPDCVAADADVRVVRGSVDSVPETGSWHALGLRRAVLVWEGICVVAIEDGCRVVVDTETKDEDEVGQVVLGPAMALLLQQRGLFALHASAAQVGSSAIAFAGDSGAGKSSIALALRQRGHRILADDIAALEVGERRTGLWRGPRSVRAWPVALRSIGVSPDDHRTLHVGTDKRLVLIDEDPGADTAGQELVPLSRVYVLRDGTEPTSRDLNGPEKALALLHHIQYPDLLVGARGPTALFEHCAAITSTVDVTVVEQPTHFSGSVSFLDRVEADAKG